MHRVLVALLSLGPLAVAGAPAAAVEATVDALVVGHKWSPYSGMTTDARGQVLPAGPEHGVPVVQVSGGRAMLTAGTTAVDLPWPLSVGTYPLGRTTDGAVLVRQTRQGKTCEYSSGQLTVRDAATSTDGGVQVLDAVVHGRCQPDSTYGRSDQRVTVRVGAAAGVGAVPVASPRSVDTGTRYGGVVERTFTITNAGDRDWSVAEAAVADTGYGPTVFAVTAQNCTQAPVPPAGTCTVTVMAAPPVSAWETTVDTEQLLVRGDGAADVVVPLRLESWGDLPEPAGVVVRPGRLATQITWDAPARLPDVGYRVYDLTGGGRTLIAALPRSVTQALVSGPSGRSLALVSAYGRHAESDDVVLDVPAVTAELLATPAYGVPVSYPARPMAPSSAGRSLPPAHVLGLSPDRQRLLIHDYDRSRVSVCRLADEVCTPVPLSADVRDGAWLPDGRLAVLRGAPPGEGPRSLHVVAVDGTGARKVADVSDAHSLLVAPDGLAAYVSLWGQVRRVRLSDGAVTAVPGASGVSSFSVARDGRLVLVRRLDQTRQAGPTKVTIVQPDGSGATDVPLPAGDNRTAVLDPTGSRVAYARYTDVYDGTLWTAGVDGSDPVQVSDQVAWWTGVVWSVEGAAAIVAVSPERLLDTRSGGKIGYTGAKPVAGQTVELQVTGAGATKVPADASAVVLNVTGVNATAGGHVTVYPCGQPRPTTSNLNLVAGQTSPNLVVSKVGVGGKVCLYTHGGTHLLADVAGHHPSS